MQVKSSPDISNNWYHSLPYQQGTDRFPSFILYLWQNFFQQKIALANIRPRGWQITPTIILSPILEHMPRETLTPTWLVPVHTHWAPQIISVRNFLKIWPIISILKLNLFIHLAKVHVEFADNALIRVGIIFRINIATWGPFH